MMKERSPLGGSQAIMSPLNSSVVAGECMGPSLHPTVGTPLRLSSDPPTHVLHCG